MVKLVPTESEEAVNLLKYGPVTTLSIVPVLTTGVPSKLVHVYACSKFVFLCGVFVCAVWVCVVLCVCLCVL